MRVGEGRRRVVIEKVSPEIDAARFPAKRVVGERVQVTADVFADGHDVLSAVLRFRPEAGLWRESPMELVVNDRWAGEFRVDEIGFWEFTIQGWVDHWKTWYRDLGRRLEAGQDVTVELKLGAQLVRAAARRAAAGAPEDAAYLQAAARHLTLKRVQDPGLAAVMERHPDRELQATYEPSPRVWVDRERARFSAWYELFPRSASPDPSRLGTLRDVRDRLPGIAAMGFDIVYLPPIHPIGHSFRKGPNNSVEPARGDVGSPWAIGSEEGGHKSVHPDLGTLEDVRELVQAARSQALEIALDIAFQCSPDHPYVREHPDWFKKRPDGTIQYAENPPKKYQDIYPFDFETPDWRALWEELLSVFQFWAELGIRAFRVDNPHTKPFRFWEWVIAQVRARHPEVIFLSEAFTHPKVMYRLAKLGFTQSYTYFAWRQAGWELKQYFQELTQTETVEFFRPSLWPNTPDILTEQLQTGGRAMSALRAVLAATLGASYGIYGPVFELVETTPLIPGKEEYLNSEKYEARHWDLERPGSLVELLTRLNRIRRSHPALQRDRGLRFLETDNERILAYTKEAEDGSDPVLVVVNLDPQGRQSAWLQVPALEGGDYSVVDLLNGPTYTWHGESNWVELDPAQTAAHVFALGTRLRQPEPRG